MYSPIVTGCIHLNIMKFKQLSTCYVGFTNLQQFKHVDKVKVASISYAYIQHTRYQVY